jgi:hypothetical protein
MYRGREVWPAAAEATASETLKVAFAPSLDLLGVPSNASNVLSTRSWSSEGIPASAGAMSSFTLATALSTPLPP